MNEAYGFMKKPQPSADLMFDSAAYFVAKHYGLSIQQVWDMSISAFEKSFVWASAAERIKSEEMNKATDGAKNKTRVESTHGPMPFSEGW